MKHLQNKFSQLTMVWLRQVVSIGGETFIPTRLEACPSTGLLWMISGISNLRGYECSSLSRIRVIIGFNRSNPDFIQNERLVLEDNEIPGGSNLLEKLQGSVSLDEKVLVAAAEAVKTAMGNLLIKKQYSVEKRDFRKRTRNDRKSKQRWDS